MATKNKVLIYKTTMGSDPESKGETSLSYTDGSSDFARNICSYFADSRGVLSPVHSTFMMLYDPNMDRYVFSHVQGQEWVFEGGARKYPYRGAFEIARGDYMKLHLPSIMDSLPRITPQQRCQGKVAAETEVVDSKPVVSAEAGNLASHIREALAQGKYLYVRLSAREDGMKENDLFQSSCFKTLILAIDSLSADFRKYATFSFMADKNYSSYLKECEVNLILPDAGIDMPAGTSIALNWDSAVSAPASKSSYALPPIPQTSDSLPALSKVLEHVRYIPVLENTIAKGEYGKMSDGDWKLWLDSGHALSALVVKDRYTYETLIKVFGRIDQASKDGGGLVASLAKSALTPEFFRKQKVFSKEDILYCEKQLSAYRLWTKDLAACVWDLWAANGQDTLSSLIEYADRNKIMGSVVANFPCKKGLGKLPQRAGEWAQERINQYILEHYNINKTENLPAISKAIAGDKALANYVLDFKKYIKSSDMQSYARNYVQYINGLEKADRYAFVKESKPILWPVCDYLEELDDDDENPGTKLRRKCLNTLHPNRKRNLQFVAFTFIGLAVGIVSCLGFLRICNDYSTEAETIVQVLAGKENADTTAVFCSQQITDLPQFSQMYFTLPEAVVMFAGDTVSVDKVADVEKIHVVLKGTQESDSFKYVLRKADGVPGNGTIKYVQDTIPQAESLFAILKDLPCGSRLDCIINPTDGKKIADIPNGSDFEKRVGELRGGDTPLTYYFWLVRYLESPAAKEMLQGKKITY